MYLIFVLIWNLFEIFEILNLCINVMLILILKLYKNSLCIFVNLYCITNIIYYLEMYFIYFNIYFKFF